MEKESFIIANPIYDSVFKYLMENQKVAKFFVETMIGEEIVSLEAKPQEYTYQSRISEPELNIKVKVYRLDFVAVVKTAEGNHKKILIEIQKAHHPVDLFRFRHYLGEQYKKEDNVDGREVTLPIVTIYILGFLLPEINSPCVKIERQYKDMVEGGILVVQNEFAEKVTHDCYIVQVGRLTGRYQTRLDKLLSLFEQDNFTDNKKLFKNYNYDIDMEEIKNIADLLKQGAANEELYKKMEEEREAQRMYDLYFGKVLKELEIKDKALEDKDKALEDKDKVIENKDKALENKDKALEEQARLIEELKHRLGEH